MDLFKAIVILILGMILLIKGSDLFVDGAKGIALKMKIPSIIIGLTLVSIGTSLPELTVNVVSSINKNDSITLGNIIGSNIFDIFIVVGISALILPLMISDDVSKYDIPVLIFTYFLLALFMFIISPYKISRIEGIIILSFAVLYIILLVFRSKRIKEENKEEANKKWYIYLIILLVGLVGLVFGARMVVNQAEIIAKRLGMSDLLIGLTIISIGTSLPEVITSVTACIKKEHDIAIGNAIGSCIFNILLIIGLSATITPIAFNSKIFIDFAVLILSALAMFFLADLKKVNRLAGIIFILIYIGYMIFIIIRK